MMKDNVIPFRKPAKKSREIDNRLDELIKKNKEIKERRIRERDKENKIILKKLRIK